MKLFLVATSVALSLCAHQARAVDQNATGMCRGFTSVDERALVVTGLHLVNGGRKTINVACGGIGTGERAYLQLVNFTDFPVDITCTLIPAHEEFNLGWRSITKTVTVSTLSYGLIEWNSSENVEGNTFGALNWECALPPGTGIAAGG